MVEHWTPFRTKALTDHHGGNQAVDKIVVVEELVITCDIPSPLHVGTDIDLAVCSC